eukprot:Seg2671.1 transcript_id=Seg2671.1/GoldUCD/mRNA.D3Y31 product="Zinc finger BED domain-containing protein 4" protein_id=Seg2671.1/GoldUCD/D3Y31
MPSSAASSNNGTWRGAYYNPYNFVNPFFSSGLKYEPAAKKKRTPNRPGRGPALYQEMGQKANKILKDIFLVPNPKASKVPRGKAREELCSNGFVSFAVSLNTEMSEQDVMQKVVVEFANTFALCQDKGFEFMKAVNDKLIGQDQKVWNGKVLKHMTGVGPLYIRSREYIPLHCQLSLSDSESDAEDADVLPTCLLKYVKSPIGTNQSDVSPDAVLSCSSKEEGPMVALDMMPVYMVEGKGFRNLIDFLEPEYKVPSHQTIMQQINKMYGEVKGIVEEGLSDVSDVAITTDAWTSLATESYATVTVNYITKEWQMKSAVLDTSELDERHSAENLAIRLELVKADRNLEGKIRLAVNAGFAIEEVKELIKKSGKLVGFFEKSTSAATASESAQERYKVAKHRLIQSCKTRWNSVSEMFHRLDEQKQCVQAVLSDRSVVTAAKEESLSLTAAQWNKIALLLPVLQGLQIAKGFRNLIDFLEPEYKVPSHQTIMQQINKMYGEVKGIVEEGLSDVSDVAITTDAWTSLATESYVTVTVNYITKEWQMKSAVLDTSELDERHSAENLAIRLELVKADWNLEGKIRLAVNAGFAIEEVKELIKKSGKLVGFFKKSTSAATASESAQERYKVAKHRLIQSCKTRWNSVSEMFHCLDEQKQCVQAVLSDRSVVTAAKEENLSLTAAQWNKIASLLPVLQGLQIATTAMSSEQNVSVSCVLPVVNGLGIGLS